jgi:hypothetical protein
VRYGVRACEGTDDAVDVRQTTDSLEHRVYVRAGARIAETAILNVKDDLVRVARDLREAASKEVGCALRVGIGKCQIVDEVVSDATCGTQ